MDTTMELDLAKVERVQIPLYCSRSVIQDPLQVQWLTYSYKKRIIRSIKIIPNCHPRAQWMRTDRHCHSQVYLVDLLHFDHPISQLCQPSKLSFVIDVDHWGGIMNNLLTCMMSWCRSNQAQVLEDWHIEDRALVVGKGSRTTRSWHWSHKKEAWQAPNFCLSTVLACWSLKKISHRPEVHKCTAQIQTNWRQQKSKHIFQIINCMTYQEMTP